MGSAKAEADSCVIYVVKSRNAKQQKQNRRTYKKGVTGMVETIIFPKQELPKRKTNCYKSHRNGHFAKFSKIKPKHELAETSKQEQSELQYVDDEDNDEDCAKS